MADYTDLDPTLLRASVSDGTNLKPSITTSSYAGGTPAAAADLKRSICYADGTLKESIADSVGVKASWLLAGSARPPVTAGLTEVATATVSGGAVSSLSITVNLEAGKSYRFGWGVIKTAAATIVYQGINSDATDGNYRRGIFDSSGTSGDASLRTSITPAASSIGALFGGIGLLNSTPYATGINVQEATADRAQFVGVYSATETTVSTVQLTCASAELNNGTWLTCWRLD